MNFNIYSSFPWYFYVFCLLAGLAVAWFTYYRNNIAKEGRPFSWPVWLLFSLRFLFTSFLCYLLLGPVVKNVFKKLEKPVIIIAADNSQSVRLNKDSAYYNGQYKQDVENLASELGKDHDVRTYSFGSKLSDSLKFDFSGRQTNLSGAFNDLYNTYYNQNIGAVIALTDGIYTQGQNPIFSLQRFKAPVFTVALGDTQPQKDVLIANVMYNKIVYAGNLFPLRVQVKAKASSGADLKLGISHKGKVVYSQPIHVDNNNFYQEVQAQLEAREPGLQRYTLNISSVSGEISYVNNTYDVFIDVLESKKKILMVARAPHPDVAAIKLSLERNSSYEVAAYQYSDFTKEIGLNANKLKNYQLVILHELPGQGEAATSLTGLLKGADIPVWYITGPLSDLNAFNQLGTGLQISGMGQRTNEVGGALNSNFNLFAINTSLGNLLSGWPPLTNPFGEYKVSDRQNIMLYQQVGRVRTETPLLMFSNMGRQKTAVLAGVGIWRWFQYDFADNGSQAIMDEALGKIVQYLAVKSDNRLFRLRPAKNLFQEDEKVSFEAEVYNPSFEPLKEALVEMSIKDEAGKKYDFNFQPRGNGYFLDAGFWPAGNYTYTARTKVGDKAYTLGGEFVVKKVEIEYLETVANHALLRNIAGQQDGAMVLPSEMGKIKELIAQREDIQPIAYMQTDFRDLIHFRWLFFIALGLMAAEWFLRKYFGSY